MSTFMPSGIIKKLQVLLCYNAYIFITLAAMDIHYCQRSPWVLQKFVIIDCKTIKRLHEMD